MFILLFAALSEEGLHLDSSDCIISYLPLAHVYERFCENLFFAFGGRVGFYSGVRYLQTRK